MKNKNITFAEVLKNRSKTSQIETKIKYKLSDLMKQFDRHPENEYTLHLGGNNLEKSFRTQYSYSRNDSRENVFDSWIQMQSGISNKENISYQARNKQNSNLLTVPEDPFKIGIGMKGKEPAKMPTQMMANLKKPNTVRTLHSQRSDYHHGSKNISEVDLDESNRQQSYQFQRPSNQPKIYETNNEKPQKEYKNNENLSHQFQKITSKKLQQVNNLFFKQEVEHIGPNHLQELLACTENIHTDIANLARRYAHEGRHLQEEQLLQRSTKQNVIEMPRKTEQSGHFHLHVGYSFAVSEIKPMDNYQLKGIQMIDHISEISSERASQRISDSGYFDFAKNCLNASKDNNENNKNIHSMQYRNSQKLFEEYHEEKKEMNSQLKVEKQRQIELQNRLTTQPTSIFLRKQSKLEINHITPLEIQEIIFKDNTKTEQLQEKRQYLSTKIMPTSKTSNQKISIVSSNKSKLSNKASPSTNPLEKIPQVATTMFSITPQIPEKRVQSDPNLQFNSRTAKKSTFESRLGHNPSKKSIKDVKTSIIAPQQHNMFHQTAQSRHLIQAQHDFVFEI